jgi:hypothetical protein
MAGMPVRYVVLRHEGVAEPHFDLMIESKPGGALMTWRLAQWPITRAVQPLRLGDHRREYLEYEGEVSGGRGWVKRIERGECELDLSDGAECIVHFTQPAAYGPVRLPMTAGGAK